VATSAVPTSATGKIAACGLEHIVSLLRHMSHVQRNKQVDYELTTSSVLGGSNPKIVSYLIGSNVPMARVA
jgi:hypothetical protein